MWLGETYETVAQLLEIYGQVMPTLIHDREVQGGLRVLGHMAEDTRAELAREVDKLGGNRQRGRHRAHVLREALFPQSDAPRTPFTTLETLLGLHVYLSHVQGSLTALGPASQALWDGEFQGAVLSAQETVRRSQSWVSQQIKVRSPQTLLVPTRKA